MATRGYIKIINPETTTDTYARVGDVLLEAHHDGYTTSMLKDVLSIPFKAAFLHSIGYTNHFLSIYFGEDWKEDRKLITSFEQILESNKRGGWVDFYWQSVISLLNITSYDKYGEISEGVERYHSPITAKDVTFEVALEDWGSERLDLTTIKLNNFDDEEALVTDGIKAFIEFLNGFISHEPFKIQFTDTEIKFSIGGIILDLLWNNSLKPIPFEVLIPSLTIGVEK